MSKKTISFTISGTIELPPSAEVIRFTDEEGNTEDHIKFAGKILRPGVHWLEYRSSELAAEKYPDLPFKGFEWEGIDDDLANDHFLSGDEKWYLQEE